MIVLCSTDTRISDFVSLSAHDQVDRPLRHLGHHAWILNYSKCIRLDRCVDLGQLCREVCYHEVGQGVRIGL